MRRTISCLLLLISSFSLAQNKQDSIRLAGEIASWYDLQFTENERDSLLDNIREQRSVYEKMHKTPIPNSQPYPFSFQPATGTPPNKQKQEKISFNIPSSVALPANKSQLAFYSIPQLASLIRSKKISSVDLTRFFIDRLKKYDDTLHAVITLTEEIAMAEAGKADEELAKGIYRGVLHGIPYGLKDLFSVKGTKTTWGSTPYKDQTIEENAFVYEQLKKAGAVLCAKLSLGALAYNDLWFGGRTNNPWNLKQGSSGSSAGSASATAAGLLPFAIGTETWGSIVSPSHRCGTTGLRPTFGSVSRSGAMVLCWSLDKIGPICRSAEDAAIVFYYIKGTDGNDVSAMESAFNYRPNADSKKLRIAYAENYFKSLPKTSHQWQVIDVMQKAGFTITPVDFPDSLVYTADIMNPIISAESAAAFDELTRSNKDDLIERQDKNFWPNIFRSSRYIPAVEYINANRHRYTLMKKINEFMKQYDVVIVPSFSGNQLAITNLTGHPVVCLPVGFTENGTPTSISFVGNLYDEESILRAAAAFQTLTDFHKQHPSYFK